MLTRPVINVTTGRLSCCYVFVLVCWHKNANKLSRWVSMLFTAVQWVDPIANQMANHVLFLQLCAPAKCKWKAVKVVFGHFFFFQLWVSAKGQWESAREIFWTLFSLHFLGTSLGHFFDTFLRHFFGTLFLNIFQHCVPAKSKWEAAREVDSKEGERGEESPEACS